MLGGVGEGGDPQSLEDQLGGGGRGVAHCGTHSAVAARGAERQQSGGRGVVVGVVAEVMEWTTREGMKRAIKQQF